MSNATLEQIATPVAFHDYDNDNLVIMSDGSLRDYYELESNQ